MPSRLQSHLDAVGYFHLSFDNHQLSRLHRLRFGYRFRDIQVQRVRHLAGYKVLAKLLLPFPSADHHRDTCLDEHARNREHQGRGDDLHRAKSSGDADQILVALTLPQK